MRQSCDCHASVKVVGTGSGGSYPYLAVHGLELEFDLLSLLVAARCDQRDDLFLVCS